MRASDMSELLGGLCQKLYSPNTNQDLVGLNKSSKTCKSDDTEQK